MDFENTEDAEEIFNAKLHDLCSDANNKNKKKL